MAGGVPLAFPNKISYMHHKLGDCVSEKWRMFNAFDRGVEFIDKAVKSGGKVLIHCKNIFFFNRGHFYNKI
jgi:protein-tyrosine phosphatase